MSDHYEQHAEISSLLADLNRLQVTQTVVRRSGILSGVLALVAMVLYALVWTLGMALIFLPIGLICMILDLSLSSVIKRKNRQLAKLK